MNARSLFLAAAAGLVLGGPALAAHPATLPSHGKVEIPAGAITAMNDSALSGTYPDKRAGIAFEQGRFSPGGHYFAFSISQIESGDPEQVWLYDLRARKLVPATEAPKKDAVGFTIADLAWDHEDMLYVTGERIDWRDQSNNRALIVAATLAHSAEIKAFPKEIAAAFKIPARQDNVDDDSVSQRGDLFDVTARNLGHGYFVLSSKSRKTRQRREIAKGGWGLENFFYDGHDQIRFVGEDGITTVNLTNGAAQTAIMARGRTPSRLLDVMRGGHLIAYSMPGSCDPDKYGAVRGGDVQYICFARLP